MNGDIVGMVISLMFFLITGLVLSLWIFYRYRERQMLIDKDFEPEQIKEFFKTKRDYSTIWLKLGILVVSVGVGILIGEILDQIFPYSEALVGFGVVTSIGFGFIAAFHFSRKHDKLND